MIKTKIILLLLIITLIGGFFRLYKITRNPPSLTGDEVSIGYSAYSIFKTGKEEHGKFLPLVLESVGDYKSPLLAYLMIIPIKFLGLNDFSVRLPNALLGTSTIPIFYFFLLYLFRNEPPNKKKLIALTGSFFLTISAWHIFYSRFAYESLIASLFVLLGVWFFMKIFEDGSRWAIFSAFFLSLTMYTAPAAKLFVPIFVIVALFFNIKKIKSNRNKTLIFIFTFLFLSLPLAYISLFQKAATRLSMVFIFNDIEFSRYIIFRYFQSIIDIPYLIFFWIRRYITYFEPDFIFFNGLNITPPNTIGLGLLYPFELPWLVLGIVDFLKRKIPQKSILIIWLVTGLIPDSLTNNQQHAGRLLHITPVIILFTTLGAIRFFYWIINLNKLYQRIVISVLFTSTVVIFFIHTFLTFAVYFPISKGESIDEGIREAVFYILQHQQNYKEIVFDPRRGVEGPYLISNPYLYLLFYSKYDPATYQTEPKISGKGQYFYKFNKYTFREINWLNENNMKDTLFIGSPWNLPEQSLKQGELLEKIYMKSGFPAFYIVSPK